MVLNGKKFATQPLTPQKCATLQTLIHDRKAGKGIELPTDSDERLSNVVLSERKNKYPIYLHVLTTVNAFCALTDVLKFIHRALPGEEDYQIGANGLLKYCRQKNVEFKHPVERSPDRPSSSWHQVD